MTDLKPGPELDKAVADKIGMVPCDLWKTVNFGAAGGPALQKDCVHASGACYPINEIGSINGIIGGVPAFSDESHPRALRLKALPSGILIRRTSEGTYQAFTQVGSAGPRWEGETEAHVLCLAFLDVGEFQFKQDGLWEPHWKILAVEIGLLKEEPRNSDDLPLPWNPEALNWLGNLATYVRAQAISSQDCRNVSPGTVYAGPEPKPPTADDLVQKMLWKIRDAGIDSDTMALVNDLLMRVWKDPGTRWDPKHHPLVG
jgi:hypothetical protein